MMKSNTPFWVGISSVLLSGLIFLFVLIYYPTGNESSWGGMGFLVAVAFFAIIGLIFLIVGFVYRLMSRSS
ncbi:putative membrane protein [Alkalihalobacillus xiaoxiensis]|uniref:Membrane protein n=1 Tax=Shouchella xiaoxiensis TaxID=766895 RepID=A0ABS2SQ84_9BACI|nr:hypothetical protein [Shouchella xiaoxiensis]MBM7836970.1 putative membrane protein [Shouchella xiaoxiensis]